MKQKEEYKKNTVRRMYTHYMLKIKKMKIIENPLPKINFYKIKFSPKIIFDPLTKIPEPIMSKFNFFVQFYQVMRDVQLD